MNYGLLYQLIFSNPEQIDGFGSKSTICILNAFIREFKLVELIIKNKPPEWSNDEGVYLAQHLILLKSNHRNNKISLKK